MAFMGTIGQREMGGLFSCFPALRVCLRAVRKGIYNQVSEVVQEIRL